MRTLIFLGSKVARRGWLESAYLCLQQVRSVKKPRRNRGLQLCDLGWTTVMGSVDTGLATRSAPLRLFPVRRRRG